MVFALAQVHVVIWFPSEILDAAAGFVYGFWAALAMLMVFWTISALISYWVGHAAARPLLYRLAGEERFRKAEALVHRGGATILLSARLVPTLEFIPDGIPENAGHIEELLREARERDEAVAGIAGTASFAGEADPYKKVRDDDEE